MSRPRKSPQSTGNPKHGKLTWRPCAGMKTGDRGTCGAHKGREGSLDRKSVYCMRLKASRTIMYSNSTISVHDTVEHAIVQPGIRTLLTMQANGEDIDKVSLLPAGMARLAHLLHGYILGAVLALPNHYYGEARHSTFPHSH